MNPTRINNYRGADVHKHTPPLQLLEIKIIAGQGYRFLYWMTGDSSAITNCILLGL